MTNTLDSGKSPMSMVSSFRRECSDQAGSDMKVSGWPDGARAWWGGTPEYLARPYDTQLTRGRLGLRYHCILDRRFLLPLPVLTGPRRTSLALRGLG